MKKLLLIGLFLSTALLAKIELKEGTYSWFSGGSQAYLIVTKKKNNLYTITGDCYYGVGRKYGPNMGNISFTAPLKSKKIIYRYEEYGNYLFILTVNKDGSFNVKEKGDSPFGHNASFYGHFTSDNLPSFPCKEASTFIEHSICNNVLIAQLDKKMGRTYAAYKSVFFFKENRKNLEKRLKLEQREWIKERNKCQYSKTYKICLKTSYEKRIKSLDKQLNSFWEYAND